MKSARNTNYQDPKFKRVKYCMDKQFSQMIPN